MKSSLLNRILKLILTVLTVVILVAFGTAFVSSYREKQELEKRQALLEEELEEKKKELDFNKEYIEKLMNDPEFFEHVARERLGYVRPNERVIRIDKQEGDEKTE